MNRFTLRGSTMVEWQTADGKTVQPLDTVKAMIAELPPEERRTAYEDMKRQLDKQIEESRDEIEGATAIKDGLARMLPKDARPFGVPQAAAVANYTKAYLDGLGGGKGALPTGVSPAAEFFQGIGDKLGMKTKFEAAPLGASMATLADPPRTLRELSSAAAIIWAAKQQTGAVPTDVMAGSLMEWFAHGFPTFELTGSLSAALMMTDVRGLLGRDLRAPFPAFAVQLPHPGPLVLPAGEPRWALVHRWEHGFRVEMYVVGPYVSIDLQSPADDAALDPWVRSSGHESVARLLVNLCVYINSLHALPTPEGRRKPGAHHKREKEPAPPQRWVLGREIKLSPGMMQAARAATGPTATTKQRAQYRMHARFMVRGHWRNQAFGKKHAERRLRWIEPFWKGPEMAEGLARLYSVEEAPKS